MSTTEEEAIIKGKWSTLYSHYFVELQCRLLLIVKFKEHMDVLHEIIITAQVHPRPSQILAGYVLCELSGQRFSLQYNITVEYVLYAHDVL